MMIFLYLLVGAAAGFIAGLFGVGGGIVVVPVLAITFGLLGFSADILMQLAVGTSLATIVVTSASSIRTHHALGNVRWDVFRWLAPSLIVAVVAGGFTLSKLEGMVIEVAFGLFALFVASQMAFGSASVELGAKPSKASLLTMGGVIGFLSALFGIGGGTITVPYLKAYKFKMQHAVGTSSACGLPIAVFGAMSAAYFGLGRETLPEYATGFVYWPAFFGIILASAFFASIGAKVANRLPSAILTKLFAVFLAVVGLQFIIKNL